MRNYDIIIKLKNSDILTFKLDCEEDFKGELEKTWRNLHGVLHIGDYFISAPDILYIHAEGEGENI